MRIGTSYKQHPGLPDQWDAIVIGSGIGGLSVAATLSKLADERVLVLERHYTAGGFTQTFRRPGYEWDVGVHYVGDVSHPRAETRRIFNFMTDGELDWAEMGKVYDRIVLGDNSYDYVKGRENFRAHMHGYFPGEKEAIDRYLEKVLSTERKGQLFFAEKAMPNSVSKGFAGTKLDDGMRTTREVLEEITQDQELIGVLTGQLGNYGLVPSESSFFIHSLMASYYFGGGAYPRGGSSRIAATILPAIERAGGEVVTNAEVAQILLDKGRAVGVRLLNGREFRAPVVISDAGAANTFCRLLPRDAAQATGVPTKVDQIGTSIAHLSLYVGLEGTSEELGLEKTNLWVYRDHRHEENFKRFQEDINSPLPLVYLSFPSAKDPDFDRHYPGHSTIEAVAVVPYESFEGWEHTSWKKRGAEYEELKASLSERLLDKVYKHVPGARGKVDIAELSTPLTTRNFAAHTHGEIYGLQHTAQRFAQRWLRPRTPIAGLYLTGADVCTAGVVGALMGGLLCASAILQKNALDQALKQETRATRAKTPRHV